MADVFMLKYAFLCLQVRANEGINYPSLTALQHPTLGVTVSASVPNGVHMLNDHVETSGKHAFSYTRGRLQHG